MTSGRPHPKDAFMPLGRPTAALALTIALALAGAGLVTVSSPTVAAAAPSIRVTKVVGGLEVPWDITWVGSRMLFNQRSGGVWSKTGGGAPRRVTLTPRPRIYSTGEGGMLGMVADPAAARNGHFYTCMALGDTRGRPVAVEVWKWKLDSATRATRVRKLITGIPLASSGRHSGCRLRFRSAKALYVGTGDAADGRNPQNLQSLGGKVLRIGSDGRIPTDNPFYRRGGKARLVWSYGHRNIQGLIKRPGRNEIWAVEHGPDRDDEVNRIWKAGNYGWDPRPGFYNESRSMTDKRRYPRAHGAKWRSGSPTVAPGGGTFVSDRRWGSWNGRLAVAMLKGRGVKLFPISSANRVTGQQTILRGYGRIRTIQQGPDKNLYFLTSNGSDDSIYRVTVR